MKKMNVKRAGMHKIQIIEKPKNPKFKQTIQVTIIEKINGAKILANQFTGASHK